MICSVNLSWVGCLICLEAGSVALIFFTAGIKEISYAFVGIIRAEGFAYHVMIKGEVFVV